MKAFSICTVALLLFVGCSQGLNPTLNPIVTPETTPTTEATPALAVPTPGKVVLQIWVPPQFDPASDTPAGKLLQARLDEYTSQRPEIEVEVRVKAEEGSGGMVDTLRTANTAAPLSLPDLVLMPRTQLEEAALKGLIYPFEGLSDELNSDDWYPFAQQLAFLQNTVYGIPFAGDGLLMLYRPAKVETPPQNWSEVLSSTQPFAFPAADSQALFSLVEYLAEGGTLQDSEGRPSLDKNLLTDLLTFYQQGVIGEILPIWITQLTNDSESWQAYLDNRTDQAVTFSHRFLSDLPGDSNAAILPTRDGKPFTLVDGWVWTLPNPHTERHTLSVDLAEFLTSSEFLGEWSAAAGYIPPRKTALADWRNTTVRNLVDQIAQSAQIQPSNDIQAVIGPALQQAILEVLKQETEPSQAAQQAIDRLENP